VVACNAGGLRPLSVSVLIALTGRNDFKDPRDDGKMAKNEMVFRPALPATQGVEPLRNLAASARNLKLPLDAVKLAGTVDGNDGLVLIEVGRTQ
jgi:hypothetical protein